MAPPVGDSQLKRCRSRSRRCGSAALVQERVTAGLILNQMA
jgi:hypothetical protein